MMGWEDGKADVRRGCQAECPNNNPVYRPPAAPSGRSGFHAVHCNLRAHSNHVADSGARKGLETWTK